MSDAANQSNAFYAKPTFWEKFWRAAGYRVQLGSEPEGMSDMPSWMRTEIAIDFGWFDRMRLLTTGRLRVSSTVACDAVELGATKSRVDWRIVRPGERER
jgi:hypothetical protein